MCGALGKGGTSLHSRLGLCSRRLPHSRALLAPAVGAARTCAGDTELTEGLLPSAPIPGLVQRGGAAARTSAHPELFPVGLRPHCVEAEDSKSNRLGGQGQGRQGAIQDDS